VASKHHADLIVMGAKGLDAVSRFLLGSVSTRVVQHATCSVLVVR
jgi:nucleotide-binding universal stress UspA family protein